MIRIIYYSWYYPHDFIFLKIFEAQYGDDLPEIAGICMFGTLAVVFNRVEALDELFVTKNSAYSKH